MKRQACLQTLLERFGCPAVSLSEPFEDGLALLRVAEERGLEGIVSKRRDAPYRSGECHELTLGQNTLESERGHTRARVRFREATLEVGFGPPAIRMGRGPENEIVVPEPLASRVHAKIEWRQDRVFLIDQSLNGTYLQMQGKPEVILRRDEIALKGTGVISLGKSTAVQEESCVRFAVLIDG